MVFQCINIRQVPREVLKTAASGLGFQHLPRDLANVNAWKNMFDPYIGTSGSLCFVIVAYEGMFEMNCLLSSSSISTWGTIKTNTYLYRAIQYLQNGV